MTKKDFLLGVLAKMQHPDDPTNDIFLWLEQLLREDEVSDTIIDSVQSIMAMAMKVAQEESYKQKLQQWINLINQMKDAENKETQEVDNNLTTILENL